LLEPSRDRVRATRQRSDDDPVAGMEFVYDTARHVSQFACDPVALHRIAHRLRYDEADLRYV